MSSKTLVLLIAGAAVVAALAFVMSNRNPDDGPPIEIPRSGNPPPQDHATDASPPVLNGSPTSEGLPEESSGDDPVSLDTLYSEFSPGTPDEWPVLQRARTGEGRLPEWWDSVIGEVNLSYRMPVPPFLSSSCFGGESDRAWLERVRASLEAEKIRRTEGTADSDVRRRIVDEVWADYSALLAAVAAKRVGDSPEAQSVYSDTTQLRDMEPGSPRARWLEWSISLVENRQMWIYKDLASRDDIQYLCAADLLYLKEMSIAINGIIRGMTREQMLEPGVVSMVRREVEGLANLIASRK